MINLRYKHLHACRLSFYEPTAGGRAANDAILTVFVVRTSQRDGSALWVKIPLRPCVPCAESAIITHAVSPFVMRLAFWCCVRPFRRHVLERKPAVFCVCFCRSNFFGSKPRRIVDLLLGDMLGLGYPSLEITDDVVTPLYTLFFLRSAGDKVRVTELARFC